MILTADLHLRRTTSIARIDDYQSAQEKKLRFILQQAQDSGGLLLVAGDFFHVAKPGEGLLRWVIDIFKEYTVYTICAPGQHDLPGHSLQQLPESGLAVIESAVDLAVLTKDYGPMTFDDWAIWGCSYGEEPDKSMVDTTRKNLLLWHRMVIQEKLWPGQIADKSPAILRKYNQFDLIVTGDNHQSFFDMNGKEKRFLVNPGSMMRMTAAQVNHRPTIYKWENNILTPIPIPIESDVLDLSELAQEKEKDERISAFVERLSTQWEAGLSFEKNMEKFFQENKTDSEVRELIWRCME